MAIDALMFAVGREPEEFSIITPLSSKSIPAKQAPIVLVVLESDLASFRQHADLFTDRGEKHEAKGLPNLMLGYDGTTPFINGKYTTSGRLLQGIHTLLEKAAVAGEAKAYVVGVDEQVLRDIRGSKERLEPNPMPAEVQTRFPLALREWPVPEALAKRFKGDSVDYRFVRQLILRAGNSDTPVLVLGESGTGKGVIARAIHDLGRRTGDFVTVNCSAIPSELLESELFGYVAGAFTNATKDKIGLWEQADCGTLFLDEIGDLTLNHQAKVLHALQDGNIRRVGSLTEISVDARIVAATNRNLFSLVRTRQFREDLYYRLYKLVIRAPALRSHPENIAELATAQWKKLCGPQASLTPDVLKELSAMRWPGNVRELNSFLEALHSYYKGDELHVDHIQQLEHYFASAAEEYAGETEDPGYYRIECLRQLRRADEVVHACEQQLKPLADGQLLGEQERNLLEQRRAELQILLENRLLFRSQETYDAVSRIDNDLGHFFRLPDETATQVRFWNDTVQPHLHSAIGHIFDEVKQLMAEH
jgi:DNA-binding NtrC family response regulator